MHVCVQLGKIVHKKKTGYLKENDICFGCLCTGHISKDCHKRISCSKCNPKYFTRNLHVSEQTERNATKRNVNKHTHS